MKVLVTGGAGYVGGVSVDAILAAGHDVVVLDDLTTGHAAIVPRGAYLVRGTYGNTEAVQDILEDEGIDTILHCAARSLVGESVRDPAKYYRDNVGGGIAPLAPINTYGETKRTFEGALHWYGAAYGLRSVILRYFNVAGATERLGEVHRPETHLIPNALLAAEGGGPITLFGEDYPTPDGTPIRDYIHVADLADAHLAALEATAPDDPRTGPAQGACEPLICNLGTSSGFSVREVLAAAALVVGAEIPHTVGPRRAGDPPVLVASNERAREVLGWEPRRSTLPEMIGSAWAWRRANPAGYGD
jgi:UDP-glucose 4-epimerase